ncbi:MAG TPA: hypothetical protein VD813_00810 [Pseudonocardia sp.]|nr:hypothetical protein [Pseudonocardia sp.]
MDREFRDVTVAELSTVLTRLIECGHADDTLVVWGADYETTLRVACPRLRVWALIETYPATDAVASPLDLLRELPRAVRPVEEFPRFRG